MSGNLKLYSYWRSSAAYRVRIALNLKGLEFETIPVSLIDGGGEQHAAQYAAEVNPQEMVPVLRDGQRMIRQSMTIIEYIDETWESPPLLPPTPRERARVRGLAQVIGCDIHPLANLRVLQYLGRELGASEEARGAWSKHWIQLGLAAFETMLAENASTGAFCEGDTPGMADCLLIPQVYNARRFGVDMSAYPTIERINSECLALDAFDQARPENQPDAPAS